MSGQSKSGYDTATSMVEQAQRLHRQAQEGGTVTAEDLASLVDTVKVFASLADTIDAVVTSRNEMRDLNIALMKKLDSVRGKLAEMETVLQSEV